MSDSDHKDQEPVLLSSPAFKDRVDLDALRREWLAQTLFNGVDDDQLAAAAVAMDEPIGYLKDIRAGYVDMRLSVFQRLARALGTHVVISFEPFAKSA